MKRCLFFLAFFTVSLSCRSELVGFKISGAISNVPSSLNSYFSPGDVWSVSYWLDSMVEDSSESETYDSYEIVELDFKVGSFEAVGGASTVFIARYDSHPLIQDEYRIISNIEDDNLFGAGNYGAAQSLVIYLTDVDKNIFFPGFPITNAIDFAKIESGVISFDFDLVSSKSVFGAVTSISSIPIPAAAFLFFSALAGLMGVQRFR